MLIAALKALFIPSEIVPVYQYVPIASRAVFQSQHFFSLASSNLVTARVPMDPLFIVLGGFMCILVPTITTAAPVMTTDASPQHQANEQSDKYQDTIA